MSGPLSGRTVALVGGAGFIGHNLALELARRDATVEIIDGLQVNNLLAITASPSSASRALDLEIINQRLEQLRARSIKLDVVDARDYHALNLALSRVNPHVIIHLAAVAHADRSNKDPYSTFDHSLRTLENSLDCARGLKVEQFVYFSSSMVYGHFPATSVTEDTPTKPVGIYGALKLSGELMVTAYQQVFGLPYTIVRPSALYGPRCISRRIVQRFIENALAGKPLCVSADPAETLDFTFISDLVDGVCRTLGNPAAMNQTFNLTYGEGRSIKDLITVLQREFPELAVEYAPRNQLTPYRGTLSVERARRQLDYQPAYPIERGVPEYVAWYRSLGPRA